MTPKPEKDLVKTKISYSIINNSKQKKMIGLRMMLDTWAGKNDGVPFLIPVGGVAKFQTHELEFTPTASIMWQTFDPKQIDLEEEIQDSENETKEMISLQHIMSGDGLIAPSKVAFANWPDAVQTEWNYSVDGSKKVTGDSAVILWWNPTIVAPNKKLNIATQFGTFIQKKQPYIFMTNPKEGIMLVYLWYKNNATIDSEEEQTLEYQIHTGDGQLFPPQLKLEKTQLDPQQIYSMAFNIQVSNEKDTEIKIIEKVDGKIKEYKFPIKHSQTWNKVSVLPVATPLAKIPILYYNKTKLKLKARLIDPKGKTVLSVDLIRKKWADGYKYQGAFVVPPDSIGRYAVEVFK